MSNPEFPSLEWIGPAKAGHDSYNKRFIVWHCTDNNAPAVNEANYALNRTDGIGTHFVADEDRMIQTAVTLRAIGHVGSTVGNHYGVALEMVGTEGSSTDHYKKVIDVAMPGIKQVCAKWGIPPRWLNSSQANDGVSKGWLTHDDCRRFFGGTTHTDPGPNFPRQYAIDKFNAAAITPPLVGRTHMILLAVDGIGSVQLVGPGGMWHVPSQAALAEVTAATGLKVLSVSQSDFNAITSVATTPATPVQVDAAQVAAAVAADPSLAILLEEKSFEGSQRAENS